MKKIIILLSVVIFSFASTVFADSNLPIQICFTPGGQCTDLIVKTIADAKSSIFVQAYSFTSAPIAKALVEAKQRGVDVNVILDKSQETARYSSATFLEHEGIPTWVDYKVAIAHNKVMVIDHSTTITGSFNFTSAAEKKNAENVLVINDAKIADEYFKNWTDRMHASEKIN